jgi:hypothetical protein
MFGLEGEQKKQKKSPDFVFDLEKDCQNIKKLQEVKQQIESRIQQIKDHLRTGDNQTDFDQFGILLHGYTSLLKVLSRFNSK